MKKMTVLSIFFLLAACLPAPQTQVTVAPTIILTPTIIPTATISPQFIALQEQISQNEMFTLNADGQIEMQTSEGMIIIPDILVSKDGTMTVTHNGETFEADASTIVIDGQKITFKDKENKTWVFDGEILRSHVEQIDISNPENFRHEEWEYLISPAYLNQLKEKDKNGELPSVGESPSYVKPGWVELKFKNNPSVMLQNYGGDTVFSISGDKLYSDTDKRPYTLVDILKTKVKSVDMIFYVIKWENSDKTSGFLGYFTPDYEPIKNNRLGVMTGGTTYQYSVSYYFVNNSKRGDGCAAYLKDFTDGKTKTADFCNYYYQNSNIFMPKDVYENWQKTGILITNSLPISPGATVRIR